MEYIQAKPMVRIRELKHPLAVLERLMRIMVRMVAAELFMAFNEFNLMIDDKEKVTVIDFPQIVSIEHVNAQMRPHSMHPRLSRAVSASSKNAHFESAVAAAAGVTATSRLASKCNKKPKERLTEEEEFMQRNDFSKQDVEDAYNGKNTDKSSENDSQTMKKQVNLRMTMRLVMMISCRRLLRMWLVCLESLRRCDARFAGGAKSGSSSSESEASGESDDDSDAR